VRTVTVPLSCSSAPASNVVAHGPRRFAAHPATGIAVWSVRT